MILLGGSLGDRFGRRRVFIIGVVWFALASLLCGLAPNVETLIAARALQGVGGALLTPGSLAILQAAFRPEDRGRAIGAWSGLAGVAGAAGPFIGGWLVQVVSWRWVFLINLPFAIAVVVIAVRHVPESRDPTASTHIDLAGAALGAAGLGALTYGLITWQDQGPTAPAVLLGLLVGLVALIGFVVRERTVSDPMLPLGIFASPLFRAVNIVTFVVYAALGGVFFWLVLNLQVVAGYSPLAAGLRCCRRPSSCCCSRPGWAPRAARRTAPAHDGRTVGVCVGCCGHDPDRARELRTSLTCFLPSSPSASACPSPSPRSLRRPSPRHPPNTPVLPAV